jgi:hypothetical protein
MIEKRFLKELNNSIIMKGIKKQMINSLLLVTYIS